MLVKHEFSAKKTDARVSASERMANFYRMCTICGEDDDDGEEEGARRRRSRAAALCARKTLFNSN